MGQSAFGVRSDSPSDQGGVCLPEPSTASRDHRPFRCLKWAMEVSVESSVGLGNPIGMQKSTKLFSDASGKVETNLYLATQDKIHINLRLQAVRGATKSKIGRVNRSTLNCFFDEQ